jgi:hypothetical protein
MDMYNLRFRPQRNDKGRSGNDIFKTITIITVIVVIVNSGRNPDKGFPGINNYLHPRRGLSGINNLYGK